MWSSIFQNSVPIHDILNLIDVNTILKKVLRSDILILYIILYKMRNVELKCVFFGLRS